MFYASMDSLSMGRSDYKIFVFPTTKTLIYLGRNKKKNKTFLLTGGEKVVMTELRIEHIKAFPIRGYYPEKKLHIYSRLNFHTLGFDALIIYF